MESKEDKPKVKYEYEWGWNDPPSLSYGDQTCPAGKKPPPSLQQRVFHSTNETGTNIADVKQQQQGPLLDSKMAPPTDNYLGKIPVPNTQKSEEDTQTKTTREESIIPETPDLSFIVSKLEGTLNEHSDDIQSRVAAEVQKKLSIFSKQWTDGKLSDKVQHKMHLLAQAMAWKDFSKAHELHVSLMVDHAGEVGQWMVGVKRIISIAMQKN